MRASALRSGPRPRAWTRGEEQTTLGADLDQFEGELRAVQSQQGARAARRALTASAHALRAALRRRAWTRWEPRAYLSGEGLLGDRSRYLGRGTKPSLRREGVSSPAAGPSRVCAVTRPR